MKNKETKNQDAKELNPSVKQSNSTANENSYEEHIPEAQGDLADRANIEIDQEIQEKIMRVRQNIPTVGRGLTDTY